MESPAPGVSAEHWELLLRHFKRLLNPGTKIYIYGSRLRGDHKKYSDLDISLYEGSPIQASTLNALEEVFAESEIPYKIDLSDFQTLDSSFQEHILEQSSTLTV